jgi:hypothetical protein
MLDVEPWCMGASWDALIVGDSFWIIYSVNKQDIFISKLNWVDL